MDNKKVSIILTTYNRVKLLAPAVESVIKQTYSNWELIVVDDGSKDNTEELMLDYCAKDNRIKYIKKENGGLTKARLTGLEQVTGDYLAWLDDDDEYLDCKLEKQVVFLNENEDAGLVYAYTDMVDYDLNFIKQYPEIVARNFYDLVEGCCMLPVTVLARVSAVRELGPTRWENDGCDDYEMWLRIAMAHPFGFLPISVAKYRFYEGNMSSNRMKRFYSLIRIYNGLLHAKKHETKIRARIKKKLALIHYQSADYQYESKNYKSALFHYISSVMVKPSVGLETNWARFNLKAYKIIKPYLAIAAVCFLAIFKGNKAAAGEATS